MYNVIYISLMCNIYESQNFDILALHQICNTLIKSLTHFKSVSATTNLETARAHHRSMRIMLGGNAAATGFGESD